MRLSLITLLALAALAIVDARPPHKCVHSKLARQINKNGRHAAGAQPYHTDGHGRFLQANQWAPIRINPVYTANFGSDSQWTSGTANWVKTVVVPEALRRFAAMLSVRPVAGPLQIHRSCVKFDETYTPAKCAQYQSESTVTVPSMTDDSPDLVLSDSSVFAQDEVVRLNSATGTKSVVTLPAGNGGWANSDLVLFVTGISTSYCEGGTIAYASSYQSDQWDRPVFGQINLCPSALSDMRTGDYNEGILVIMHEMTHVMGMDASLFPLFRFKDANLTPRTPRDPLYPFLPAPAFNRIFECDGSLFYSYIPGNTTVQWQNERGMPCNYRNATHSGACVARIVTPAVRQAARSFFNCPNLAGAELENWDTSDCAVIGSHWEARSHWADMMNPFSTGLDQNFTIVTLAMFDDSGWYSVNYSTAYGSRVGSTFGYKQGCGLARDDKCLKSVSGTLTGGGSPAHYFPQTLNTRKQQCRLDRKGFGVVAVYDYPSSIPLQYRYFSGSTVRGGGNEQLDYCPVMMPDSSIPNLPDGLCSSSVSWNLMPSSDQARGMRYGTNSVCLSTTLYPTGSTNPGTVVAGCYQFVCTGPSSATVTISTSNSGFVSATCATGGQALSFTGYSGSITCPDLPSMCADRAATLQSDIFAMGLAAITAEQQAVVSPAPYIPMSNTRLPSYLPSSRTSGNTSSGGFLSTTAWIAIIAAIAGIAILGAVVSCVVRRARMKRMRAAMQAQQGQGQGGQGGQGNGIQMTQHPIILQGIPVGGGATLGGYPPRPQQEQGYPQAYPQPYPQAYPGYAYPQQQGMPGGSYYPQPQPMMAPPIAPGAGAGGSSAATGGYSSYPPTAISMDPIAPSMAPVTMAAMPPMAGGAYGAVPRPSVAATSPVLGPLGLTGGSGSSPARPPPYNPGVSI